MTVPFRQSAHYREVTTPQRTINLAVVHITAAKGSAMSTAMYNTHRPDTVSAHYFVDNTEIVQGVRLKDVAFAAPGANSDGVQIEICCPDVNMSREKWRSDYLNATCLTAKILYHLFKRYQVPIIFRDHHDLLMTGDHHKGVTTHLEVNNAYHQSTHTDPGPGFPMSDLIAYGWNLVKADSPDDVVDA